MENTAQKREHEEFDNFRNIHKEFGKRLEKIVRSNGGVNLLTNDGNRIDFFQLIHAHGLFGVRTDSNYEIVEIEELQQSTATGRVYASCKEYDELIELDFEFVGSIEDCNIYFLNEKTNNANNK